MGSFAWHVFVHSSLPAKVLVLTSCGLLLPTYAYGVRWMVYYGIGVTVQNVHVDPPITRLHLQARYPIRLFPGCYFYIRRPWFFFREGSALMLLWSGPEQIASAKVTDLHFLALQEGSRLKWLKNVEEKDSLLLDGPYGRDLHLQKYETVVLTARGKGITSILPLMLHLTARKKHDDDIRTRFGSEATPDSMFLDVTRKVDLIWILDKNEEQDWVGNQLKELQALDAENVSIPLPS